MLQRLPSFSAHAAALALTTVSTAMIGCALPKPPPETMPGAFAGPPVTLGESLGKHVATIECPTPGWGVGFDQLRDAPEGWTHAFLTLRRPSPIFVYPQVVTNQEVLLNVAATKPVRVYVRVVDHDATASGAYRLATESTAR